MLVETDDSTSTLGPSVLVDVFLKGPKKSVVAFMCEKGPRY